MSRDENVRLVFSTGGSNTCPRCGWPLSRCACSTKASASEPVPSRITAKLRMEKAGRGGKTVTVIDGLPKNETFLKELCAELKRSCGVGGAVREGVVELQGEQRERVRPLLVAKGFVVKG